MNTILRHNEFRLYNDARPYITGLVQSRLFFLAHDQREDIIQETLLRAHLVLERQGKRFRTSLEEIRKTSTGCLRHILCEAARNSRRDKDAIEKATLALQEELRENVHDTTCEQALLILEPEQSTVSEASGRFVVIRTEWSLFVQQLDKKAEIGDDFWETEIERKSHWNLVQAQLSDVSPEEQYREWQRRKRNLHRFNIRHKEGISEFFKERGICWESLKSLGTRREVSGDSAFWSHLIFLAALFFAISKLFVLTSHVSLAIEHSPCFPARRIRKCSSQIH